MFLRLFFLLCVVSLCAAIATAQPSCTKQQYSCYASGASDRGVCCNAAANVSCCLTAGGNANCCGPAASTCCGLFCAGPDQICCGDSSASTAMVCDKASQRCVNNLCEWHLLPKDLVYRLNANSCGPGVKNLDGVGPSGSSILCYTGPVEQIGVGTKLKDGPSGAEIWANPSVSGAVIAVSQDKRVIFVGNTGGNAYGLDAATGKQIWAGPTRAWSECVNANGIAGPVFAANSSRGGGGGAFVIACFTATNQQRFTAISAHHGLTLWTAQTPASLNAGWQPPVAGVVGGVTGSAAYAWSAETGKLAFTVALPKDDYQPYSALHLNQMMMGSSSDKFQVWLLQDIDSLAAMSPTTGKQLWTLQAPQIGFFAAVHPLTVFANKTAAFAVSSKHCDVHIVAQLTGATLWASKTNFTPFHSSSATSGESCLLFASNSRFLFVANDKNITMLSLSGGSGGSSSPQQRWTITFPRYIQNICTSANSPFLFVHSAGCVSSVSTSGAILKSCFPVLETGDVRSEVTACIVDSSLSTVRLEYKGGDVAVWSLV